MTREEKIAKIYKIIADKTLSFGCKFSTRRGKPNDDSQLDDMIDGKKTYSQIQNNQIETVDGAYESLQKFIEIRGELYNTNKYGQPYKCLDYEIIGHPVMIGDVLDWLYENKKECDPVYAQNPVRGGGLDLIGNNRDYVFHRFNKKREPIENQSDECIDYIYNLITNNG